MKNLLLLLERFSKSLNKDVLTKEIISKAVEERTRVKLEPKQLFLKKGVLEVNTSAAAKSEIRLKEESIKFSLRESGIFVSRIFYK